MSFQAQLPARLEVLEKIDNKYCTGKLLYRWNECLSDEFGNPIINWQLWYFDAFTWLTIIACFGLLVLGTYLLINDLATEERRDTLNFIRLSPRSPQSILAGKMLGVPILIYLGIILAVPLHLYLGLNAAINLGQILSFYTVVITASFLYFSGALLFGLVGSWLGGFQAWLGSGALLGYLIFTKQAIAPNFSANTAITMMGIINPYFLIPSLETRSKFDESKFIDHIPQFAKFNWFNLPLGNNFFLTVGFALLVYSVGAYFIWQSLQRCFRDPNATMLNKKQSYLLTACFTAITLGCANWQDLVFTDIKPYGSYILPENMAILMFLNFCLFLYLIAALSPNRQTLQDWTRYRHVSYTKGSGRTTLIKDLILGEKSPAILAIAINIAIAVSGLSLFVLISQVSVDIKRDSLVALVFASLLVLVYAALTQLILFVKSRQSTWWATGILIAVIMLPPFLTILFFSNPSNNSFAWLFTVFAPMVSLYPTGGYKLSITAFLAMMGHFVIFGSLVFQLTRKLKKAGESATKALLAGS
jgi:ABC-type Na+ efflux pump permease subunit